MEKSVIPIYEILQKLTGLHRELMNTVREEREGLAQANLEEIKRTTDSKQELIEEIYQCESVRLKLTGELALSWKRPVRDLTLPQIILEIQGRDPKGADQLRSAFNTLTILIQRISSQNLDNRALLEQSLVHVHNMKRNALEESGSKSNTYTQQGQKTSGSNESRLISREA